MLDLSVIILTYNEKLHIARCLERLTELRPARIIVVDSHSTDGTQAIACAMGAEVVEHDWPGNQAEQFNWALDNLDISTEWILRLDADEYLSPELMDEIRSTLPTLPTDVSALIMPLGRVFMGRTLKHGIVNGVSIVRLFRSGTCRYEHRLMDEHLQVLQGRTIALRNKFYDDSLLPIADFITKHNDYALREAALELAARYPLPDVANQTDTTTAHGALSDDVAAKRRQKDTYARMPLFVRAFGYFVYRYIVRLGFLDGREGFLWDFLQGWWYRTLVDAKILEISRKASDIASESGISKAEATRQVLEHNYGLRL